MGLLDEIGGLAGRAAHLDDARQLVKLADEPPSSPDPAHSAHPRAVFGACSA
jgi:hypothetical protein